MDYNMVDASEILRDQERKTERNIDITLQYLYGKKPKGNNASIKITLLKKVSKTY